MCEFADEELEEGIIVRVQEYEPSFKVCNLDYIGKVTIKEFDENGAYTGKYLAFVTPDSKVFAKDGSEIPLTQLVEKLRINQNCCYVFKERVQPNRPVKPMRERGLLVELKVM